MRQWESRALVRIPAGARAFCLCFFLCVSNKSCRHMGRWVSAVGCAWFPMLDGVQGRGFETPQGASAFSLCLSPRMKHISSPGVFSGFSGFLPSKPNKVKWKEIKQKEKQMTQIWLMTHGNVLRTLNGIFVNSVNKLNKCIINKMKKKPGIYGSDDLRDQTPGQGRGPIDYHFHFIKKTKTNGNEWIFVNSVHKIKCISIKW